jgi:hypothetical protein
MLGPLPSDPGGLLFWYFLFWREGGRGGSSIFIGWARSMVAQDIDDLDKFARKITVALALGILLVFALAGLASVLVTRRTELRGSGA